MKNNYSAWKIKVADFYLEKTEIERLKFLLGFAILAPSSHNSQPWAFNVSEKKIQIFLEQKRLLPIGDADNRQATISLGCAAQNIMVAADYYGYKPELTLFDNGELVAEILFANGEKSHEAPRGHQIFSALRRVTNRNEYSNKPLPNEFLDYVGTLGANNLRVNIITNKEMISDLADVAIEAGVAAMKDPGFRLELSHHIKNNLTGSFLGMPCFGLGIPTPMSFLASSMIRLLNMNRITSKKDRSLLKDKTHAFLLIDTEGDQRRDWFFSGRFTYQKIALFGESMGVHSASWASAIQTGNFSDSFRKIANTDGRPQFFARIGLADTIPNHSPRLLSALVLR